MKTVLVTGAAGFIGRHSIPGLLAKGYEVHALYSRQEPVSVDGVHWHQVDLLNSSEDLTRLMDKLRPSHALHFAWYTAPGLYWTSMENLRWFEASLRFIRTFHACGGWRLVVAGTCAEYDWSTGADLYQEHATPMVPSTLYGSCKHSLQAVLASFSATTGLSYAWGRIFLLYGPHEHPARLVSGLIQSLLKRQATPCSLGEQVRDVLYVKDVANAFVELLDSKVAGPLNIASGEGLRIRGLIDTIVARLDGTSLIRYGERPMPAGEPATLVADVRRLNEELQWHPMYTLQQGLEETIDWWRERITIP